MIIHGDVLTELLDKGEVTIYHNNEDITKNKLLNLPLSSNFYSISLQCGIILGKTQPFNPLIVFCVHDKNKHTDVYTIQFKNNNFSNVYRLLGMFDEYRQNNSELALTSLISELMMTGDIKTPTIKTNPKYTQNELWYMKQPKKHGYYRIGHREGKHTIIDADMSLKTLDDVADELHKIYNDKYAYRKGQSFYVAD